MEKEKTPASRERILETAVKLFAKKGFAGVGMRELAEDAGVNLAMINYFFGSKKDLLKVILDTFFKGYLEIVERELRGRGTLEQKIRRFIHGAVEYISNNRNHMIVTFTELPHDDPDITEYKASWARQAMLVVQQEICVPLEKEWGKKVSPAAIGPLLIGMMSSRFILAPVMEQIQPLGYGQEYFEQYPEIITQIFLHGIHGTAHLANEDK